MRVRRGQTVFATLLASLVMSGLVTGWGVGPARAANKGDRESWQAASTVVVQAITTLSQSTFESVGIQPTVAAPVILHGQSKLVIDGKPEIFYEGAEPCPYCAAERWAFIIALARFGTWSGLGNAAVGQERRRSFHSIVHILAGEVFKPLRSVGDPGDSR